MEITIKTERGQCPIDCLFRLDCNMEGTHCPIESLAHLMDDDFEGEVITEVTKVP